ncbi:SlyX family protein [Amaricoccus solimangrovi]|uniref:SlyX family protein n=1 Tax=Amaricoccus solimangrovi TaxID=2589815 RepID=A0A501WUP0_9RHOB|nr:SlyX family protein [Amaricoccus solimangrovi]TPE53128.1 SlyX family protein [Amaricoccus solimangrovi]
MAADPDRLTALEIALTHLELRVEELSDVVRDQGEVIDRLRAEGRVLALRLAQAEAALPDEAPDPNQPPPHW